MFAKQTIKRASNRVYHIMRNADEQARSDKFYLVPVYSDPEFSTIVDHNNEQMCTVNYLQRVLFNAQNDLSDLRALPWYRKLFLA